MSTYVAWWPITDHGLDRTRSQLTYEAAPDLAEMLTEAGHVATGPARWSIEAAGHTTALIAEVPVHPSQESAA